MEDILVEIITNCISIEKRTRDFYTMLSRCKQSQKLKEFWISVSKSKEFHLSYFHKLLVFAKQGMIPQIFSKPFELKDDLIRIRKEMDVFFKRSFNESDLRTFFICAYYSEHCLLHETFITLYRTELPKAKETPATGYSAHIIRLKKIVSNSTEYDPVLMLLGDALVRIWRQSELVVKGSLNDALTGILSRQGFFHKVGPWIEMMVREKKVCAVFVVDIDHLKKINENHDYKTGDRVIRFVARQLSELSRKYDIIGRFSGEEFVIFMPSVDKKNLKNIAERFRKSIEKKSISKEIVKEGVTVSIGGVYGKIKSRKMMDGFMGFIDSAATLLLRKVKKNGGNNSALMQL